jgi:hypothetical protein
MKKFIALVLAFILILPVLSFGAITASANPVAGSLFAYYSFNEVVQGLIVDGMGRNHGELRNGASIVSDPARGQVLSLDGTNQYVLLADNILQTLNDVTIAVWYKWTDPDLRNWARVYDFGAGNTNYYMLTPQSGAGTLRFEGRVQYPGNRPSYVNGDVIHDEWVHVATTVGNGRIRIYVNGEFVDENDFEHRASEMGPTNRNYIGNSQWPDPFFHGLIDDLAIYSAVLTQAQIREVMNHSFATPASAIAAAAPPAREVRPVMNTAPNAEGMFLRYTMNEIADGRILDDVNGNHGIVVNGASIVNDAARGPVLHLDGTNQHIRMPNNATMGLNAMTIAAWYKWTDDNDRHWSRVVDLGSGTNSYIFISPRSGHDTIMFETRNDATGSPVERVDGDFSRYNEWVHVAGVIVNGNMMFYINGELAGERGTDFIPSDLGDSNQNWLGRSQFASDAHFMGYIDDFVMYNRALTEAEIRTLMNQDWSGIRGGVPAPAAAAPAPTPAPAPAASPTPTAPAASQAAPTAPRTADPITLIAIGAVVSAAGIIISKRRKK